MSERRVVDPKTGGEKGSKLARFDLIPQDALWEVAEHYGRGSRKYEDRNWEKGYQWSLSIAALQRHLSAFIQGNDYDDDPSLYEDGEVINALHITAVAWHALALLAFSLRGAGTDDRPKRDVSEEVVAEIEAERDRLEREMWTVDVGGIDTQHDMLQEHDEQTENGHTYHVIPADDGTGRKCGW